jgi:hypothetical protein
VELNIHMGRLTLAGGPLRHLLAQDARQAFGAENSPLANTFFEAWESPNTSQTSSLARPFFP